jgi:gliding motility-associated-like protein
VVYQSINNAATNCQTNLQNCLFYNEATPMLTSLTAGPDYWFDVMNCIIWTPGSPYTGGYSNGSSSIMFDNCDVDGPLPSSSSIDADPIFVNASGGNFRVSACSPVVDAGFPWTSPGQEKDFTGSADRVQGAAIDIGPYEQVKGATATAPTAIPQTYCENAPATALTATGSNLLWYTAATGGTGDATAPIPSTTTTGSTTWYVTQTPSGSCESPRTPVAVTINPGASAPTATPQTYCENAPATALTATGSNLLWYTAATGGTGAPTAPTPSTTTVSSTTWYVTQTPSGTCESQRTALTVTISTNPTVTDSAAEIEACAGDQIKLEASGATDYDWSPATFLSDPSVSDPALTAQSSSLYTVTGTTNGCSATATVQVTIKSGCSMGYYIPNAFSPNGDGANDLFRVKTSDVPRSFNMIVFNRYGGKIFETADIGTGWNGAIGGNLAPAGTYVYAVVLTTSNGSMIRREGTVILVR